MVQEKGKYTIITGASSGIGFETAKVFAGRGKNLVIAARHTDNLEMLKKEILDEYPDLDIVIRSTDLSVPGGQGAGLYHGGTLIISDAEIVVIRDLF